jgi:hypothetical protein
MHNIVCFVNTAVDSILVLVDSFCLLFEFLSRTSESPYCCYYRKAEGMVLGSIVSALVSLFE